MFKNEENLMKELVNELNVLQSLNSHPNIVTKHEIIKTKEFIMLFMELCNVGTLHDITKKE